MEDQIALQLYTLRHQTKQDFPGSLRAVADAGYRAVETAGFGTLSAAELAAALKDLGLTAISAHVPYDRLNRQLDQVLRDLDLLGSQYVVLSWVGEEHRSSTDAVRRLAAQMNEWGERSRAAGLWLGYHNHQVEFAMLDGTTMYDLLASETDPNLVHLQPDVHWVRRAGFDPVELIERYAGRVPTVHAKDMSEQGHTDTPVGDGTIPWDRVLAAANAAQTRWFIVEQEDDPDNAVRDIRRSLENLRRLLAATPS